MQRRCAEADQQIERLQKELAAVQKYKKKTYENYVDGVLDKEEYLSYKAEYEKQDKDIRAKIQLAEQEKDSFGEAEESMKLDREIYQVWNIIRSDKRNCDRID